MVGHPRVPVGARRRGEHLHARLDTLVGHHRVPSLDRMPNGRSDRRELRRRLHLEQRSRARGGGVEHLEEVVLVRERHDRWDRLDTHLQ